MLDPILAHTPLAYRTLAMSCVRGDSFLPVYWDDLIGALAFGRTRKADPGVVTPILYFQRRAVEVSVYIWTRVGWKQREGRKMLMRTDHFESGRR